ncbi:hypothetical protein CB1_000293016 [Camelus ferus]|nr:hypothetical protein CB1_000293016 [Camelus ferus]
MAQPPRALFVLKSQGHRHASHTSKGHAGARDRLRPQRAAGPHFPFSKAPKPINLSEDPAPSPGLQDRLPPGACQKCAASDRKSTRLNSSHITISQQERQEGAVRCAVSRRLRTGRANSVWRAVLDDDGCRASEAPGGSHRCAVVDVGHPNWMHN